MIDLAFDIRVQQGEFALDVADRSRVEVLGLFGPSGSGKTTLLETIAGIRTPTRGEIVVGERTLFSSARHINLPPRDRHIGYVPQEGLLFPHMSVRRNLLYGGRTPRPFESLRVVPSPVEGRPRSGHAPRLRSGQAGARPLDVARGRQAPSPSDLNSVAEMLEIASLLDRRVHGLSGGERQRIALGRALMTTPALLLLDEPLAAVDRARRERILPYLLRIRRELHVPLIYVTHDASELAQIADRVLVIDSGSVMGAGDPRDVLTG